MTPDLWRRIEDLYQAALDSDPSERAAVLAQADPEVRVAVQGMLDQPTAGCTLDSPAWQGVADTPLPRPSVGSQLGPYRIEALLGSGGMGAVYRAMDTRLNRAVAVKIPSEAFDTRFETEARSIAALNHPNICTVHDVGPNYLVMELVEGPTLAEDIRKGPLPLEEALAIARQIADALEAAHERGIIHRDLKPANVKIKAGGLLKLLDFGLAKRDSADGSTVTLGLTESGIVVGTPAYMAPEQAQGQPVDKRADVWAFGVLLYELLTGRPPFRGDSLQATFAAVLTKEPDLEKVPRRVRRLLRACLSKDPKERLSNIGDWRSLLDQDDLTKAVVVAKNRSRWMIVAALTIVLALAAATAFVFRSVRQPGPVFFQASVLTSFVGQHGEPSLSPDGNQYVFTWDGDVPGGKLHLYLSLVGKGTPLRLTPEDQFAYSPAWSPDGQSVAFIKRNDSGTYDLTVIPALGGAERRLATAHSGGFVGWSPDSHWLLWCADKSILAVPAGGGEPRKVMDAAGGKGYDTAAVSPDGRQIVFARVAGDFDEDLFVAGFHDGNISGKTRQLTFDHTTKASPVWTADGREIVYVVGDSFTTVPAIRRISVDGGVSETIGGIGTNAFELTYSAKAHRLLYSTLFVNYDIHRLDLRNPKAKPERFLSSNRFESNPSYSPDGKRIAFDSNRGGTPQIWVADADGNNPSPLTAFKVGLTGSGRWSPDGQSLVFDARPESDADVYTISAFGGPVKKLTDFPGEDHNAVWSADGKWIYFGSRRLGQPQIFRMHSDGSGVQQMTTNGGILPFAAPDGKWLYYTVGGKGIWKMPVDGGTATQVLTREQSAQAYTYTVTQQGIYAMAQKGPKVYSIVFYPFDGSDPRTIIELDRPIYLNPAVSPDGHYLLYTTADDPVFETMLVENFR